MAKQIRNEDIFAPDLVDKTKKDVQELIKEIDNLSNSFVSLAKKQKEALSKEDLTTLNSIKKTDEAQKSLNKTFDVSIELDKQKEKLTNRLKLAEDAQAKANASLNIQIREQNKLNKQAALENKNLVGAYSAASARLNRLRSDYKNLAIEQGKNSKEARALRGEITQLDKKLKDVDKSVGQSQRNVGNYTSAWGRLGGVLRSGLGFLGITAGIAGVASLITSSISIFRDFEAANSKLQSVLGATKDEMAALSQQAKDLGASTAFTASQVTELQTEFAKLGFPTNEILNMTESTLAASAAMGSQLGEQAALTGATLKAFGLTSKDAARVNDVLAKSTARSALDFSKLNNSMSTIAPVAKALGFGLEDTVALLGNLSDSGFDASTAATATRNIMLNLANSSGKLAKRLKEPVKDLPSLIKGLKQLKSEGIDLAGALELTDVRSVAAFNTFIDGTESLEKLSGELKNAKGAAQEMADVMLDNLSGDITIAQSAWEGFILSLEDGNGALSNMFRGVVQGFTAFLGILTKVETEIEKSIISLEKEQAALTSLQIEINTTNVNSQRRIEMVRQLKEEYPDLLEFIDAETASNEDLQVALDKVNQSVRTRMLIQKAAQKSDDLQALSTARRKQAEELLNDIIIEGTELLFEQGKADLLRGKTAQEQVKIIKEHADTFSGLNFNIDRYNAILEESDKWQKITNEEKEKSKKVIQELISNVGDLNELTTQELKNLIKTGVLTDKKLNQQAREIIITRELKDVKKLDTEATEKSTKASKEKENQLKKEREEYKKLQEEIDKISVSKLKEQEVDMTSINKLKERLDKEALLREMNRQQEIEREKKMREIQQELTEASIEVISDLWRKGLERRIETLNEQIRATQKRADMLRERATRGQLEAEQSLAVEKQREAELEKERQKAQKRLQQQQALFTVLSTYQSNVAKGDPTPLQSTIRDIGVIRALASTLSSAYDGVDDTGNAGNVDKKGGKLWVLHPNEQVWSKKDRKEVGFRNRDEIKDIVKMHDTGIYSDLMMYDKTQGLNNVGSYMINGMLGNNKQILTKLDQLNESISKIDFPDYEYDYDFMRNIIKTTKREKRRTTITRRKGFN